MAWTNWGFDGTINEAQWAQMAGLLGNGYVAAGNGDCLVTAVGGARSVSVAAGTLYGDGVVSVNSAPETVAMTTPVNGQWFVIALRRTWATNTSALVAIAGATTSTTTPTAPPTSFPTLNTNVGVLTDQPIAWAWCNSANTTVVVYDIRLKAVKSLPPVVANGTERDAKFMSPTQGLQVWRDDLGAVQTYFGLYNASTNPGGRDSAGWYTSNRASGIVPIRPTTATIVTGTGSANSIGTVSFTGASSVSLNGVFTSEYKNYKIIINVAPSSGSFGYSLYSRFRTSGTDYTGGAYYLGGYEENASTLAVYNTSGTSMNIATLGTDASSNITYATMEVREPEVSGRTGVFSTSGSYVSGNNYSATKNGLVTSFQQFDGVTFFCGGSGTISGTVQVLGFNG